MALGISVIICCYNSSDRLPETLGHLAAQVVPDEISWEIIVVDNGSEDSTYNVAISELQKYAKQNFTFKVLRQPIPGKIFSLKYGIEKSKYDFLIICDDDNWLCDTYITTAFTIMQSDNSVGVIGGCGVLEPEIPSWNQIEHYKSSYITGPQPWANIDHWVYGAGCVQRKSVLSKLIANDWSQITVGRVGSKLGACEDVEICFMVYLTGYKIIADDRLIFKHFVPLKRQNFDYLLSLAYWQSYCYVLLIGYIMLINNDKMSLAKRLRDSFTLNCKALILLGIKVIRKRFFTKASVTFKEKAALQSHLGTIYSIIKNRKKIIKHHQHLLTILKTN